MLHYIDRERRANNSVTYLFYFNEIGQHGFSFLRACLLQK